MLYSIDVIILVAISIPFSCCVPINQNESNPIVCIADGCIQGKTMENNLFEAFLGVPFAEPPIGNLRFANPIPAKAWTGILDATSEKSECIQKNVLLPNPVVSGSEDCLYLNVYRPIVPKNGTENKLLSVLIFIHGGGYFAGSPSMAGPQYFMENGEVILVAMAYRLGVFGFFSTGDEHSPGNFGLKDQNLALRWVKNNIKKFGGDETSVTLFGVSAGASSTQMHMMSPLSQGLFEKAIVMSGSAIAPYNDPIRNPYSQAKKQASVVGIQGINNKDLVAKLRKVDAVKMIDSIDELKFWSVDPLTYYRPVIEQNRTGAFLTVDPKSTWQSGKFLQIPWMTGVVQHEGAVRAVAIATNKTLLEDLNSNLKDLLPKLMELEIKSKSKSDEIYEKLKNYYLNGRDTVDDDNVQGFIDMFSDRAFMYPYYKAIHHYVQYADTDRNPVSLYRFAFKGPLSYSLVFTGSNKDYGVVHLDDTIYLFQTLFPPFPKNSVYANVTKNLVDFYVSFAKNGRPLRLSKDPVNECNKFHAGQFCDYQEFANTIDGSGFEVKTGNDFNCNMVEFWDNILMMTDMNGGQM